ncbi:hypothetical protein [Bordetella petrii]|uniref:Transposase n=2 Tax=Alcaligenaceae TaxID=506 RepID=A0ABT7W887_9BORD|nr:hypothetical protein [Bordetella petrii]MDM9561404.1 hypothetical protein [Bordetella petrii]
MAAFAEKMNLNRLAPGNWTKAQDTPCPEATTTPDQVRLDERTLLTMRRRRAGDS